MSDTEAMYRVVTTRKNTIPNPKYTYWNARDTGEPSYLVVDGTTESYSKPYATIGAAKAARTRAILYNVDTLISMDIQKAVTVWTTLAEGEK